MGPEVAPSSPVTPEVEDRVGDGRLGALASRLGRRFVTLFSIGALLPLVAFATLSVTRVSQQMEADVGAALHRAAKSSGMSVAARLGQLAGDLRLTADLLQSRRAEEVMAQGDALHGQVHEHCEAVWLYRSEGPEALLGGGAPPDLTLNERQRQHLAGGAPLATRCRSARCSSALACASETPIPSRERCTRSTRPADVPSSTRVESTGSDALGGGELRHVTRASRASTSPGRAATGRPSIGSRPSSASAAWDGTPRSRSWRTRSVSSSSRPSSRTSPGASPRTSSWTSSARPCAR